MTPQSKQRYAGQAYARFFIRIGQVGRATEIRDPYTKPLFSLPLIMDAEGLLSEDARNSLITELA